MKNKFVSFPLILIAIICSLMSAPANAKKMLIPNPEVPLELGFIIRTLQEQNLVHFEDLYPHIQIIDKYAQLMPKEDIFLVGKIEIYKTFLKNDRKVIKTPITKASEEIVENALKKTAHPLVKWFLQALLKDIRDLLIAPFYNEYILQRNNGLKIERVEIKRLEKRSELLQQWVSLINPQIEDASDILIGALKVKMFEAIKHTAQSFRMLFIQTDERIVDATLKNELKFFSIQDIQVTKKPILVPEQKEKSVEEIIDPVILQREDLPLPSQENWLNEAQLKDEMENLPKPANDADTLQDF